MAKKRLDEAVEPIEQDEIATMPLESLEDYMAYNEKAREANKKLRVARYPIKQCPVELHPKQRCVVSNVQQPTNPTQVCLDNELINYREKLLPGKEYDLPLCVIEQLEKSGTANWGWKDLPNGDRETFKVSTTPRFSVRRIYS